jgi:1-deoxy-D-xylulose-5-phosphate reductoisomerase
MKKIISILGSTGSIGNSTLNIIDTKKTLFKIYLLSANKNFKAICKQIRKYKPIYFVIVDKDTFIKVKKKIKSKKTKIINDFTQINLRNKTDITVSAIPGIAGLSPTIHMIKYSKKILLANKESIICGWDLIKKDAYKNNTKLIPVDSEHFSILKLIENHNHKEIKKIYLTASGGPFLNYNINDLKKIKPKDAVKHPKWNMGKKISVDSSTLMNKLLEMIEAQKLFNLPKEKLDIIIHPESLVHAIVEFKNGLSKFIYHETSMKIPIANAIFDDQLSIDDFYKIKKNNNMLKNLTFKKVDKNIFPIIKLKNKVNKYSSSPIIINAANEVLVDQFLKKKIHFLTITEIIRTIMNNRNYSKYAVRRPKNIKEINFIDLWARKTTLELIY